MQETNLYTTTVPPMTKALTTLSKILNKLDAHAKSKQLAWHPKGMQESALLNSRLISDQFPFIQQVQIACDNAKNGVARLAGVKPPVYKDSEKTIKDLKARIDKTVKFLKTIKAKDVVGQEARKITLPYWSGKSLSTFDYVTQQLMPNFYFHIVTAYSILRKNGVGIGKGDYIGGLPLK